MNRIQKTSSVLLEKKAPIAPAPEKRVTWRRWLAKLVRVRKNASGKKLH